MALNVNVVALIRDEIGPDLDFANNAVDFDSSIHFDSLENIYNTVARGNSEILRTALLCWRMRRADYVKRGFDASVSGSLLARRQRMLELNRQVYRLELLVDTTARHVNSPVLSTYEQQVAAGGSEF
jgi:hypothetical protein